MAAFHQTTKQKSNTDWDIVSDVEELGSQERLSVASFSSDESDAVIIFGGHNNTNGAGISTATIASSSLSRASSLRLPSPQQQYSQTLFNNPPTLPIEERLLDQIAKLAEELEDSQEQAKLLLLQNDRLMTENEKLQGEVDWRRRAAISSNHKKKSSGYDRSDIVRAAVALAGGVVLIGLVKKKLLVGVMASMGVLTYHFLNGEKKDKQQE